ncbi:porin [Christiangramia marina]|uniref:porin n=1 Tax=Christiangramia marina TaxID=409436 RepID=UPI003AA81F33
MKKILFIGFSLIAATCMAQDDWSESPKLSPILFVDTFYSFDFDQPEGEQRQNFFYNHNRHNEVNLNLGLLGLTLDHKKYRANLTLQAGTYALDNYSAEKPEYRIIHSAFAGIALDSESKIWLDAGIFPSHIGFESAKSKDNYTLTRSISAENSPYFLTGVKVSYELNESWFVSALLTNGWQRIERLPGNSLPGFGTQVTYSNDQRKFILNWSSYIGSEFPDSNRKMRIFNDFYGIFQLSDRWSLISGFDIGVEENADNSGWNTWFSPTLITYYQLKPKYDIGLRAEYFQDKKGVVISQDPLATTGMSFNFDYKPSKYIAARLEGRALVFEENHLNSLVTINLAINFDHMFQF